MLHMFEGNPLHLLYSRQVQNPSTCACCAHTTCTPLACLECLTQHRCVHQHLSGVQRHSHRHQHSWDPTCRATGEILSPLGAVHW